MDGIIYISGQNEIKKRNELKNLPVVYIDRAPRNAEVLILSDHEMGGYLAGGELIRKGCTKILFFRDIRYASTIRSRRDGYIRALQENGMALACVNVLTESGIKAPDEIKVMGFDNISLTQFTSPQISTISQDTRSLALHAGETILRMINHEEVKEKKTVIPVTLIVRGTT